MRTGMYENWHIRLPIKVISKDKADSGKSKHVAQGYKRGKNLEKMDVITHYDKLIDENNDPFRDSPILKEYMDKWDGPAFIDMMRLSGTQNVLEIGVGTGRIAGKVASACSSFCGIDISSKTIVRAKENLRKMVVLFYQLIKIRQIRLIWASEN